LMLFVIYFFKVNGQPLPDTVKEQYNHAKTAQDKRKIIFKYLYINVDNSAILSQAGELARHFQNLNDQHTLDYIQLAVGIYLAHTGDYNEVLNYAIHILSRSEKRKDDYGKMLANRVISLAYYAAADMEKTIYYDKETVKLAQLVGEKEDLSQAYNNLGADFSDFGHADSGFVYAQLGVKYAKELNDPDLLSTTMGTLGENYLAQKKYDSALVLLNEALIIAKIYDDLNYVWTLNDLAQVFIETNKLDSATLYAREAVNNALKKGFRPQLLRAYNHLYTIYENSGPVDSSLKFLKLVVQTKDTLFSSEKTKRLQATNLNEQVRQQQAAQERIAFQNKIKFYSLLSILFVFLLVAVILFRNNKQKQKANLVITEQKMKAENALSELKITQAQLIQSEKMASLGELTAGIAHEIQNPLNFVNNFSEVNTELIEELKTEKAKPKSERDDQLEEELLNDIAANEQKINHHGKRADAIVKGMLQHSRSSSATKEPTDINKLVDEYLRLAYHGIRAKDNSFNATLKTDFDDSIGNVNIIPQDIGRVVLNLITNAFYAVGEKKKTGSKNYEPTVVVKTSQTPSSLGRGIIISVTDNGNGIPSKVLDKIFQPFFTTKPTGQGTGLGLSLSYDIVKAHGGVLKVETKEGEGSAFIIQIPTNQG